MTKANENCCNENRQRKIADIYIVILQIFNELWIIKEMDTRESHLTKVYRQERYFLGCPRGYSNMPKLQNDPIINNGASALSNVSVIVFESSTNILTELVLAARNTFNIFL